MAQKYATIKWVTGEDHGKITPGIPVKWIKNFNYDTYLSDEFDPDESYVIEWRDSAKEPPGGWKLYDGLILDVATSVRALEKKSKIYDLPMSPRIPIGKKSDFPADKEARNKPSGSGLKESMKKNDNAKAPSTASKLQYNDSSETDGEGEINDPPKNIRSPLREMNNNLPPPRVNIRQDSPERNGNVIEAINELRELVRENLRRVNDRQPAEEEPDTVELGSRGSNVRVTAQQWQAANEQTTYTAMAISLLMSTVNLNQLLTSNVKGGKSKIRRPDENPPQHQALDPNILNAIAVSVRRRFKDKFKTSEMNRAINTKLSSLRREARKRNAADNQNEERRE